MRRVVERMVFLGENESAVRLLLESAVDPSSAGYVEDCLRACLVSSAAVAKEGSPHPTIKVQGDRGWSRYRKSVSAIPIPILYRGSLRTFLPLLHL